MENVKWKTKDVEQSEIPTSRETNEQINYFITFGTNSKLMKSLCVYCGSNFNGDPVLRKAIEKSLLDNILITDEASALEYINEPVHVVQGRSDNIKITYTDDLELARLILQSQQHT